MLLGAVSADGRLLDCKAVINDGEVAVEAELSYSLVPSEPLPTPVGKLLVSVER